MVEEVGDLSLFGYRMAAGACDIEGEAASLLDISARSRQLPFAIVHTDVVIERSTAAVGGFGARLDMEEDRV